LAYYCRDGDLVEIEGANKERLTHYRRLVYNVMYGILENAYPITKSLLSEPDFKTLVNGYMTRHDAQDPQVWKVPGEFCDFYRENPPKLIDDYPYLLDLLRLEWLEILVYNQEDAEIPENRKKTIEGNDNVVVNPDFELVHFEYPVYKGEWDDIEVLKGDYYLLVFRNIESKKVHFLDISALHVVMIENLEKISPLSKLITHVLASFNLLEEEELKEKLLFFVNKLYEEGFVLGVKP
jgi:hypothetical protein